MNQATSTTQKTTNKTAKSSSSSGGTYKGFTTEEKAAMKARAKELKDAARRGAEAAEGENAVQAAIDELPEPERAMAKRLHALIKTNAPSLMPRLWYGMPAYYKDGKVLCHFQSATKFKTRYASIGFSDAAKLDDDDLWPVAYALKDLTPTTESKITALLKKAVG